MNISSISQLSSLLNTQSTETNTTSPTIDFQSYLTDALGESASSIDISSVLQSLGVQTTTDATSMASTINSLQSTASTSDVSRLLASLQSSTSTDYSTLLSEYDSETASNYSSILTSLEETNSDAYGSLLSSVATSTGDMMLDSFKSDLFKNLNAAKAKLEGSYTDYAARIGTSVNEAQQVRLTEMQNNIATLTNFMSSNTATQAYTAAKQQTTIEE